MQQNTYHLSQPANQQVAFDKFEYSEADKIKLQHSARGTKFYLSTKN